MKIPYYHYHCWYCGDALKDFSQILPTNLNIGFYPFDLDQLALTCGNHKDYFVNYFIIENVFTNENNIDYIRPLLNHVQIYKNNMKEFLIFYPISFDTYMFLGNQNKIKLPSSIWTKESDPEKIYEKAQMLVIFG